jgi:hypothetical protein
VIESETRTPAYALLDNQKEVIRLSGAHSILIRNRGASLNPDLP